MIRRPSGTPANPHGDRKGARRTGPRPRARLLVCKDARELPLELRKASGLSAAVLRRLRPHVAANKYADPPTGQVYSARLNPVGTVGPDGYVRIGRQGPGAEQYAHRIVYEAVNGPIPAGKQIDHRNGNRADNRLANLDMVSRVENVRRAVERCMESSGVPHPSSVLTPDLVCEIRASDRPTRQWARELGADAKTVRNARRGTTWRHVVCRGARAVQGRGKRRGTRRMPAPGASS